MFVPPGFHSEQRRGSEEFGRCSAGFTAGGATTPRNIGDRRPGAESVPDRHNALRFQGVLDRPTAVPLRLIRENQASIRDGNA
jgi:hypothetical protein